MIFEYSKAEGGGVVLDTSFGDEFGRDYFGYIYLRLSLRKVIIKDYKLL